MNNPFRKSSFFLVFLLVIAFAVLGLSSCTSTPGPQGPTGAPGPTGVSITDASINTDGHLVIALSNGEKIDAGIVNDPQASSAALPDAMTIASPSPIAQTGSTTITMGTLFSLVGPVIVRVDCQGDSFTSSGSGIIIRKDGYILTNEHVVDQTTSIKITLSDNNQYPAAITASDANMDMAILKLTEGPINLPVANLGSMDDIVIGGTVIVAGFPLGQDLPGPISFTQGIVSSMRTLDGKTFIQTDSVINPGNSGGALVNGTNAKIIGMPTALVSTQGQTVEDIGLAIPIDVIQAYIQQHLK
jgi:S1-C subfamily serine protease